MNIYEYLIVNVNKINNTHIQNDASIDEHGLRFL